MRRIRRAQQPFWRAGKPSSRVTLANSGLADNDRELYRNVDSEWDLPFPLSYRGGQLVVEYATVCFRSQEDCRP
jgi:hypothetical protein